MDKIVVTSEETRQAVTPPAGTAPEAVSQRPALPIAARIATIPLVLVLPLLCLATLGILLAQRSAAPRVKLAWTQWMASLLVASGLLTCVLFTGVYFLAPKPVRFLASLPALEYLREFPTLPAQAAMNAQQIARDTAPLVFVVSPDTGEWQVSNSYLDSAAIGAGVLLMAQEDGFLVATNRHVVDGDRFLSVGPQADTVRVFSKAGDYAQAQVVARHKDLDLALLWIRRGAGEATYVQPVASFSDADTGRNVFVIGHPQRLFFSISTGIVMRMHEEKMVQISAPVSPGNSGGPVYDEQGNLLGVVSYKVDRRFNPNAENLNFAVRADALLTDSPWDYRGDGEALLRRWREAHAKAYPKQAARN